jgi:hypothetical protein
MSSGPTGALLALRCSMNAPLVTAAPPGLTPAPDLVGSGEEVYPPHGEGPGVAITFLAQFTPKEQPSFRPPRRRKPAKEMIYSAARELSALSRLVPMALFSGGRCRCGVR